ncbi:bifunctional diaminohydroxyphosphoribosylaminopyrimidine deaminase/5-amino-6-(5-phosphoribosylamino)uracil reductase RibD [Ottowia sp. GY511]|uniref:Riboflavin biosynthesis protein RibD n=1 Tax=Ottowia flava TaxID=2675430 RepID=A0ABW4KV54_9BURK|nr:bifunctional diaminohydroxyphosphoribosylaminopyrimidine deaminase/5-amino-6-(5-phosphoribosylamino)uracil reductase RibD [Ottowia sp. GY511]TXK31517.1 bifunctional diaminohydroxyphosphoribosylaminopyrimidine deaminase/5-amino-6-(5-phosphoribosylamino)uracil reductase RibD [Ottowia sp. GY511]
MDITSEQDDRFMAQALALAERARWHCPPNPAVGCVIVDRPGQVIGQGQTQPVGQAHAEIMALRDAAACGHSVRGATVYVTLEPCAHQGRTGPCCEALAAAGVGRVVAALEDPNPRVAGQGIAHLRAAGVQVDVGPGAARAREINLGFFSRMARGVPWVRLKVASSLDGRTALPNGASQWITSDQAREDGHRWRARAGAVLTGIGTVLEDDPLLNVRLAQATRQPPLVIVDSRLQTPPDARLWSVPDREVVIYAAATDDERKRALEAKGAIVVVQPNAHGKVDLAGMLCDLGRREVNELHVEAGFKLNGSLLRERCVDELLIYQAPSLLGEGSGIAAIGPLTALSEGIALQWYEMAQVGTDLRLIARVSGRATF